MALFATFVSLLMGLSLAEGTVLCIEEDGHVAVEAAHNGLCGVPYEPTITDAHCGSCVDIQVSTVGYDEVTVDSQRLFQQVNAQELLAIFPAMYSFGKSATPIFSKHIPISAVATFTSLRTTILLI